jgi:hypothetical protein
VLGAKPIWRAPEVSEEVLRTMLARADGGIGEVATLQLVTQEFR